MEANDWPCHAQIFDPKAIMQSKKHKCDLMDMSSSEKAQNGSDRQPGIEDPLTFTSAINRCHF